MQDQSEEVGLVESAVLPDGTIRVPSEKLAAITSRLFVAAGVGGDDAALIADVLVSADLRGIRSHGVARIPFFVSRIERGTMLPAAPMIYERMSDTTGFLDAADGIGIVAASKAMDRAVEMAVAHGSGFVAVANSSHFGHAGAWAARAMESGCIGIAMSNSGRRTAPTFSVEPILGTNPIAFAMSGGTGTDFLLDMATSTVAAGRIETALREAGEVPEGWVDDSAGLPALDERGILTYDAPLLPLGGRGDATGGHKGYGLSLLVELLCGAMSGTGIAARIAGATGDAPAAMGHFLGAIRLDAFRPTAMVERSMDETFSVVRGAAKANGHDRIFIHGEPEAIAEEENTRIGVPVTPSVAAQLRLVAERLGLEPPL